MERYLIKPVDGAMVRDPRTMDVLKVEGEEKVFEDGYGTYWRRRVRDGSVTIEDVGMVKLKTAKKSG